MKLQKSAQSKINEEKTKDIEESMEKKLPEVLVKNDAYQ